MTNPTAGFQLAPRHVTISTVAPTPESFAALLVEESPEAVPGIQQQVSSSSASSSAVLAWSVHSSKDDIRQQLVPTTQYSMIELRNGLRDALLSRTSKRLRTCMLEMTLLDGINDTPEDAHHLAQTICQPLIQDVPGLKLVVNLIPWNDIGATFGPASLYQTPSLHHVREYQSVLQTYEGISCFVRTTRGDDESAACGMLATSSKKKTTTMTTKTE
jgi:23S rRNA (adenine2503-C2)-methyltransferase